MNNSSSSKARNAVAAVAAVVAVAAVGGSVAMATGNSHKAGSAQAQAGQRGPGGMRHAPSAAQKAKFQAALAAKLGVSADAVKTAVEAAKPAAGTRPDRIQFATKVATSLNLPVQQVEAALYEVGPRGPRGGRGEAGPGRHMRGAFGKDLAAKLGVTTDQLKAAMKAIRPADGTRPDPTQLASKLAAQLNIPVDKVTAAFAAVRAEHPGGPGQGGPGQGGPGFDGPHPDGPPPGM